MQRKLTRTEFLMASGAAGAGAAATLAGTPFLTSMATAQGTDHLAAYSPDGSIAVRFGILDGAPTYSVYHSGRPVVVDSSMGFHFEEANPLNDSFELASVERSGFDETWRTVWGSYSEIRNHYNELVVTLRESDEPGRELKITFRIFADGVGFRYEFPEQEALRNVVITDEKTEFRFLEDHTAWSIPANYTNYEYLYSETPLSRIGSLEEGDEPRNEEWEKFGTASTPVTVKLTEDLYAAIHEAALYDYADMTLAPVDGGPALGSALVPRKGDGDVKVRREAPFSTPWRVLILGESPGALIESTMVLNLNEPCKIEDTSWIKPGKYVGVWWEIHKGQSTWAPGPDLGATTENSKRYIDFAGRHGIPYFFAEGWNVGWQSDSFGDSQDFSTPNEDFDLEEVISYARERGVEFLGHNETGGGIANYERQLDTAFRKYQELGMPGVKTGYAGIIPDHHQHDQWMVRHYQRVIEKAAKYNLTINNHEPIKPTGIERTYPNFFTREGVQGMEYEAWSGGNPAEHTVTLPFTRMVAGPLDYNPGIFNITWQPEQSPEDSFGTANDATRIHTTRAHQMALHVILLSPLQMLPDIPENYEGVPEFEFMEQVPTTWEETRVLNGAIGDYVTLVRRSGSEWYIGSATDEQERTLTIPLNFLGGGKYVAHIYGDGPDTDLETNPGAVQISRYIVTAYDVIEAILAESGGQAVRIAPATGVDLAAFPHLSGTVGYLPDTGGPA